MKIKCSYCGSFFDDTNAKCPGCGATNEGVVRTTSDQPLTIEQLKQWYKDRGLPPAETTRFFIGVDYKSPRAFGIYKDEATGNFVVYKNKDDGQRAIRYQGTDEAYAVNELFMRLKQEIIQQKMNNVKKKQGQVDQDIISQKGNNGTLRKKSFIKRVVRWLIAGVGCIVAFFAFFIILGEIIIFFEPKTGYYAYQNEVYYRHDSAYNDRSWYVYETGEWSEPILDEEMPQIFQKKKTCKPYYIAKDWDESIPCTNFDDSPWYKDLENGIESETGYYAYDSHAYYHSKQSFYEWYKYDKEWTCLDYEDVPEDLKHSYLAKDYYRSDDYGPIADETDFKETLFYRDLIANQMINTGYFKSDDQVFYHLESSYEEGWYYYDDNDEDWSAIDYDSLPEDFKHPSLMNDFYFTPTWDSSTQFTDFEKTSLYKENKPSSDSSSDSDYDWDSGDSWDSGTTDWGSDW